MRALVVAVVCAVVAAGCAYTQTEITPKIPENAQSSKIYAADGTLITTLHGPQNRLEVKLDRIPLVLQHAVIAIEDERFYYHRGVDFRAIFRAAQHNAAEGAALQGGSTITQQLVKNTLLNSGKTLDRKIQEASLAWQLEEHYSKDRILEIYLNTVYFGNGNYGVEAASEQYFGKPVEQLDAVQAATIAGLIQAPSDDDPVLHPDAAVARRNVVLAKMQEQGYLSQAERDSGIAPSRSGLSPTPTQDRYPAAHFVDEVKKFVSTDPRFGATQDERDNLLFSGGLAHLHDDRPRAASGCRAGRHRRHARPRTDRRPRWSPSIRAAATCAPWSAAATSSDRSRRRSAISRSGASPIPR